MSCFCDNLRKNWQNRHWSKVFRGPDCCCKSAACLLHAADLQQQYSKLMHGIKRFKTVEPRSSPLKDIFGLPKLSCHRCTIP